MALPTVHISKEAILTLMWAARETFKKECLGFLLGYTPTPRKYYFSITAAAPFQCVKKRKNTEVEATRRSDKRLTEFIDDIKGINPKHIGSFHSHPEWGDLVPAIGMSDFDREQFLKNADDLALIITISSRKRARKKDRMVWEALENGDTKGSFGKYDVHLIVYGAELVNNKLEPRQLKIVMPRSIEMLNCVWTKK